MLRVQASAPTRIDLAGGTLDLWPIHHLLDQKCTVNVGVTLHASALVTLSNDGLFHINSQDQDLSFSGSLAQVAANQTLPLPGLLFSAFWHHDLPPVTLTTSAKSPAGAGLGGSSCLGIAIAGALCRARKVLMNTSEPDEFLMVRTVQDAEARLIHAPTGCQDYWGGVRGRINIISFPFGRTDIQTLNPEHLPGLQTNLLLCYSGRSRASAINNWEIFKRLFDGDRSLLATFNQIGALSEQCANAIIDHDLSRALHLSEKEWELRKSLWPAIESPETKRIDTAARGAGARFSRVCGAGGGGVMAVFASPEHHRAVREAMIQAGGIVLDAGVAETGLTIHSTSG